MGPLPTGTVATTIFVTSEITLTVSLPAFATRTSDMPLSYATPWGAVPTWMVATTVGLALAKDTNEKEKPSTKRMPMREMVLDRTSSRFPTPGMVILFEFDQPCSSDRLIQLDYKARFSSTFMD